MSQEDDYIKATAAPGWVTIGGKRYQAGRYGPRDRGDFNGFLRDRFPDPRLMARELCQGQSDAGCPAHLG